MRGAERQDAVDVLITELFANGAELQLQPQSLLENAQMARGRSLTGAVVPSTAAMEGEKGNCLGAHFRAPVDVHDHSRSEAASLRTLLFGK